MDKLVDVLVEVRGPAQGRFWLRGIREADLDDRLDGLSTDEIAELTADTLELLDVTLVDVMRIEAAVG